MDALEPGMLVECIDITFARRLTLGAIYTVAPLPVPRRYLLHMQHKCACNGRPCEPTALEEVPKAIYSSTLFRPVRKPSIEVLRKTLEPVDA